MADQDNQTTGILVTNLGTPEAPTAPALRRYLREFLWDPRIVELPRWAWWLILNGIIIWTRPSRSAHAYEKIWTSEGAPLLVNSRGIEAGLRATLDNRCGGRTVVALGMRYGQPSIAAALEQLRSQHIQHLLVLPLYPQYSASTTASTFDAVAATLKTWRWLPELRMVTHYHRSPAYIQALADSIREAWESHGQSQRLLFSFHGLPQRAAMAGDPYPMECQETARLVADALQLSEDQWWVAFQSRFGYAEWLKPYTDQTLKEWGRAGVKSVDVVCPGFSADCLETLEEIAMQNRDVFLDAGGETYRYIPALNDRPDHIQALADVVMGHTRGWLSEHGESDENVSSPEGGRTEPAT